MCGTIYGNEVRLTDGYGNPINSYNGAINIHDPHGHTVIINERFHQHTATTTTLAADATSGSTQITLTSATGFAVGDYLHIQDGVVETIHPQITTLVGTLATLDHPLDYSFLIGDTVTKTLQSMDVLGTLSSPQSFKVHPPSDQVWQIMRILIEMSHGGAGDNGLFGDLTKLTNGCVIRRYDGATGQFNTFTVWKSNGDLVTDMFDVVYAARSGGGGSHGTNGRGSFYNTGAVVKLDGTVGDYLELLIQDDLTELDSFRIKAQGHTEGA